MSKHFVTKNERIERVHSLSSICMDTVATNIENLVDGIMYLPPSVKSCLFKKVCAAPKNYSNINLVLRMLVNSQLETVDFTSLDVDDELLSVISCCSNLSKLLLSGTNNDVLTESVFLEVLPNFTKLLSLQAPHCSGVTDAVITTLVKNCPRVTAIDISHCSNITDIGMMELAKLENLTAINISKTKVTNAGIIRLAEGISGPKLKEIRIAECTGVDQNAMNIICERCRQLEIFVFYNCKNFIASFTSETHRSNLKNLRQLTWTAW